MQIAFNDVVPIYIQIADAIEDDILSGKLQPGEHPRTFVVSSYNLAELEKVLLEIPEEN